MAWRTCGVKVLSPGYFAVIPQRAPIFVIPYRKLSGNQGDSSKVLRNTYALLSMTLLFSAAMAGL
ncbi:MAG TPA: hypothetical protein ENK35_01465, partial [Candidatus Tenderia sp.]|nr:hypothetical protein [Candidatus Tenderia sp.]